MTMKLSFVRFSLSCLTNFINEKTQKFQKDWDLVLVEKGGSCCR